MPTLKRWNEEKETWDFIQVTGEDIDNIKDDIMVLESDIVAHKEDDADNDVHNLISDGKVIEETDENQNGNYIKFSDGTLICWKNRLIDKGVDGEEFEKVDWVYPHSFISRPSKSIGGGLALSNRFSFLEFEVTGSEDTEERTKVKYEAPAGPTAILRVDVVAIGRWK